MKLLPPLLQKYLFVGLIIIAAFIIFFPAHNFQPALAQGDHGRDFYAFTQITKGEVPYQDFWWVYGPVTPYCFALVYKLFGASIQNAIMTQLAFRTFSAIFFYLALTCFTPGIFAFAGALWFLMFQPTFSHTYTHAAGITASLAMIYFLFRYIQSFHLKYLYFGLATGFILSFMKINFGIVNLMAFSICILAVNYIFKRNLTQQKIYFVTLFCSLPLIGALHWALLRNMPFYEIRQCFPLLNIDHPHNASALNSFYMFAKNSLSSLFRGWITILFSSMVCLSFVNIFIQKSKTQDAKKEKSKILFALSTLVIFFFFNLHEFLVSGVYYRSFWAKPFQIMLLFLILGAGTRNFHKIVKAAFLFIIISLITMSVVDQSNIIRHFRHPSHRLTINKTDIFTANAPRWLLTVYQTTHFLNAQLKEGETFFALPYDPLYYFLAEKQSPTRQLIFFDHINIPAEQEIKIISELERKKVNYVVLSNRCDSKEHGLGTLGGTYCPLIASYLVMNFEVIQVFGDWANEPGWSQNHGTRILKRIEK